MPPSKNKMSGKAVPPSQLLEQMEKMNDMLNAENKMMEEKIGEMNRENVEWMKKCSELQNELEGGEQQHEQALTLLTKEKTELEGKLKNKEKQFDIFKQQCLTAAKTSVETLRKNNQSDVEALSKALEDSSEALKKADEELKRMKLKEMIKDDSKKKKEEAQEILEMFTTKEAAVRVLLNSLAAKQHSLKQFEAELKTRAGSLEKMQQLEVAVEEKERMIESLLHRMEVDREAEAKEKQVVAEMKEALEKAQLKMRDKDSDLADFEEEISKLLNANNEYEQELQLTRRKLAEKSTKGSKKEIEEAYRGFNEAMQIQKDALAKVEEEKRKVEMELAKVEKERKEVEKKLDEVERRGIARQANATAKFTAETSELKEKLKVVEEEKEREVNMWSGRVADLEKVMLEKEEEKEKEHSKIAHIETMLRKKEEEKVVLRSKLTKAEEKLQTTKSDLEKYEAKIANSDKSLEKLSMLKEKLVEKQKEMDGMKLQFDNRLSEKDSEIDAVKKKADFKLNSLSEKLKTKEEDNTLQLSEMKTQLSEKEKLLQNLTERVQKYKKKETKERDEHSNEISEKEAKIKALEASIKESLSKEKESQILMTKKFEKELKEKESLLDEVRTKYENMKEKARKYKNEAKFGSTGSVAEIEVKLAEKEAKIEQLVKELEEKEGIIVDIEKKRKQSELEVAGQHSLQLTSYQTECGSLKQQLDLKTKEVEQLQEKVNKREVENDDEIYLLKKEIKNLTADQQNSGKSLSKEDEELLKKAKRKEKEDMKLIKKLEEKVQKYKLIIKDAKKRKLEEKESKSDTSFKIPKKGVSDKPEGVSLLELVTKAQEWTEKTSKKSESEVTTRSLPQKESESSLIDIPLPEPVLSIGKSPIMELQEAPNPRFYQQRSPPRQPYQWSPPPRREERSRGFNNSRERQRAYEPSQQRGYHSQPVPAYDPASPSLSYPPNPLSRDPRRRGDHQQDVFPHQQQQGRGGEGGEQSSSYLNKVYGILSRAGHSTSAWQQPNRWQPSNLPRYGPY